MKNKKKLIIIITAAVILIAAVAVTVAVLNKKDDGGSNKPSISGTAISSENVSDNDKLSSENGNNVSDKSTTENNATGSQGESNATAQTGDKTEPSSENGGIDAYKICECELSSVFSFSGKYVEDGSDVDVKNIAAIKIKNVSDRNIEYMRFTVNCGDGEYNFTVTTIPIGETVTVFESEKKTFGGSGDIVSTQCDDIAYFSTPMTIYPDVFEIYTADMIFTVKNISDSDINGDIYIYYKSFDENGLYGGITYRVRVSGLACGAMTQVQATHFSLENSKVVFVSYAENNG